MRERVSVCVCVFVRHFRGSFTTQCAIKRCTETAVSLLTETDATNRLTLRGREDERERERKREREGVRERWMKRKRGREARRRAEREREV